MDQDHRLIGGMDVAEETREHDQGAAARYFTDGGCVQVVHGLADAGPLLAAGFEETDEAAYRAAVEGGEA
jgi:hypothetical protein